MPCIIDTFQRAHGAGRHRVIGVFHLSKLDPAPRGVLFPQKIQPFFRYGVHHVMPPIVMP